jgi:hypothetical protein
MPRPAGRAEDEMNDYTAMLIATGRMDDLLREAERIRLARLARRPAPAHGSGLARLLRQVRGSGSADAKRLAASSGEACAC